MHHSTIQKSMMTTRHFWNTSDTTAILLEFPFEGPHVSLSD